MRNIKKTFHICAFAFLIGSVFIVQCDRRGSEREGPYQEQGEDNGGTQTDTTGNNNSITDTTDIGSDTDTTNMRYGESQLSQDQEMQNFQEERDELITNLESLREDISARSESQGSAGNTESSESIESDLNELDQAIANLRNTRGDNWDRVKFETEQLYDRISSRYEESTGSNDQNNSNS